MLIEKKENKHVVTLTLNRPDKKNALSFALMEELLAVLYALPTHTRVVLLEGAGPFFCSGLDLEEAVKEVEKGPALMAKVLQALALLPSVTIAKVHGGAFAGGLGLVASCDLAIASREATFSLPEMRRGLIPALVHILLKEQALSRFLNELVFTGEPITALRAHSIGLINEVVAVEELDEMCSHRISQVLKSAPTALQLYKKHCMHPKDLVQKFEQALQLHQQIRASGEAEEGIRAFLEKRAPNWS